MQIRTLITITTISFLMNGCLLDRIQQRLSISQNAKQEKKAEHKIEESKKEYKPSKPTEPIYTQPDKIEVEPAKEKVIKSTKKTYKPKKTHKKKLVEKMAPEPYSIEKHESDPELLGPQTTLKSNPLTKKDISLKKDKKKG